MKKSRRILSAALLSLALLTSAATALGAEADYGAPAAKADLSLTLEEMLTYSIQDEYLAEAEYVKILAEFGQVRPFSNIVMAEGRHIAMLEPLFASYGFTVPVNEAAGRIELPETLVESFQAGVTAEILNIEMYDRFLKETLPEDVRLVFERLKAASENHLAAFERAVQRSDGSLQPGRQPRSGQGAPGQGSAPGPSGGFQRGAGRGAGRGMGQRVNRCN